MHNEAELLVNASLTAELFFSFIINRNFKSDWFNFSWLLVQIKHFILVSMEILGLGEQKNLAIKNVYLSIRKIISLTFWQDSLFLYWLWVSFAECTGEGDLILQNWDLFQKKNSVWNSGNYVERSSMISSLVILLHESVLLEEIWCTLHITFPLIDGWVVFFSLLFSSWMNQECKMGPTQKTLFSTRASRFVLPYCQIWNLMHYKDAELQRVEMKWYWFIDHEVMWIQNDAILIFTMV